MEQVPVLLNYCLNSHLSSFVKLKWMYVFLTDISPFFDWKMEKIKSITNGQIYQKKRENLKPYTTSSNQSKYAVLYLFVLMIPKRQFLLAE